jgi:putative endonuclease
MSLNKFYIGETSDVNHRIQLHLNKTFKSSFSKAAEDWILKLSFQCQNRNDALYLEKFIKKMKSKAFIEKIIDNPAILKDILSKK